jgi:hypothetical protein
MVGLRHTISLELDPIAYSDLSELVNYAYHYSKLVVHNSSLTNAVHPPLTSFPSLHHAYHENAHSPFAVPYWLTLSETGSTKSLGEIMVRIIRRSVKAP